MRINGTPPTLPTTASTTEPTAPREPAAAPAPSQGWQPRQAPPLRHLAERVADAVVNTVLRLDHGKPTKLGGILETQDWLQRNYPAAFTASPRNADGSPVADPRPWPRGFGPGVKGTTVFVHNEKTVAADPSRVLDVIRDAGRWGSVCDNLSNAAVSGGGPLTAGGHFNWTTFGSNLNGQVVELEQRGVPLVIGWRAKDLDTGGKEIDVYHRYLLYPTATGGTRIVTEESQRGFLTRPLPVLNPNQEKMMHAGHEYLLDCVAKAATDAR